METIWPQYCRGVDFGYVPAWKSSDYTSVVMSAMAFPSLFSTISTSFDFVKKHPNLDFLARTFVYLGSVSRLTVGLAEIIQKSDVQERLSQWNIPVEQIDPEFLSQVEDYFGYRNVVDTFFTVVSHSLALIACIGLAYNRGRISLKHNIVIIVAAVLYTHRNLTNDDPKSTAQKTIYYTMNFAYYYGQGISSFTDLSTCSFLVTDLISDISSFMES